MRIVNATGIKSLEKALSLGEYEVVCSVDYNDEIMDAFDFYKPEIFIISSSLTGRGNIQQVMIDIKKKKDDTRIIYLHGEVNTHDDAQVMFLSNLISAGIYDIVLNSKLNKDLIKDILDNPKDYYDVKFIHDKAKGINKGNQIEFEDDEKKKEDDDDGSFKNLFIISSIKPGTGKSFLSTNLATAIAKHGNKNPKVALIEADLQNLSIGTLLNIEDDKNNLKTVMDKIKTIFTEDGSFVNDLEQMEKVDNAILSSFKQYEQVNNLHALVGSQLSYEEVSDIKPMYYAYLITVVCKHFDIVIVDTNSSLAHTTTLPLLQLCNKAYYVLNLDFNNVRNNIRYRSYLEETLKLKDKIKYVLNEDITHAHQDLASSFGLDLEPLDFTSKEIEKDFFKLEAKIPLIPKSIFLNRLYNATPVILSKEDYLLGVRYEILKLANAIVEIDELQKVEAEIAKMNNASAKKKKRFFF